MQGATKKRMISECMYMYSVHVCIIAQVHIGFMLREHNFSQDCNASLIQSQNIL